MRALLLTVSLSALVVGCASNQIATSKKSQREAEEEYGRQQMMMTGLNETSSEQAAARHQDSTIPVERPGNENKRPPQ